MLGKTLDRQGKDLNGQGIVRDIDLCAFDHEYGAVGDSHHETFHRLNYKNQFQCLQHKLRIP
jgi:hypothetical protein